MGLDIRFKGLHAHFQCPNCVSVTVQFQELLSLAKKKKTKQQDESATESNNKKPENTFTDSDTSDSDDDWDARGSSKKKKKPKPAKRTGKRTVTKSSGSDSDSNKGKSSEPEEGKYIMISNCLTLFCNLLNLMCSVGVSFCIVMRILQVKKYLYSWYKYCMLICTQRE